MPLHMKTYLALLWGASVVCAMESDLNSSTTETSSINSMAAPHTPAESRVASPAEITVEHTTADAAHPSHNAMILETANPKEGPTRHQTTDEPASAPAAAVAVSPQRPSSATESEVTSKLPPIPSPGGVQAPVSNQTHSAPSAATAMTASPASEAAAVFVPTSTELLSTSELVSVTQTPVSTSPGLSSAAESPTITRSTQSASYTTDVSTTDVSTTKVSTTDVSTTKVSTTDVSTTDVSTTKVSTTDVSTTDVSTTKVSTTDVSTTEVSTTKVSTTDVSTTDVSTTDVSTTDVSTIDVSTTVVSTSNVSTNGISTTDVSTTGFSTTDVSTTDISTSNVSTNDVSTTDVSTSPAGILIPRERSTFPVPSTRSPLVTTSAPCEASPSTKVPPCSNRHQMKRCLITIASLAAVATVFMVSTIILCTKLSKRKYKVKKPNAETEMMCISALLPERLVTYSRQPRHPVTNGVLVIHDDADSDEDGGDNVTLRSFLPENDRFV